MLWRRKRYETRAKKVFERLKLKRMIRKASDDKRERKRMLLSLQPNKRGGLLPPDIDEIFGGFNKKPLHHDDA